MHQNHSDEIGATLMDHGVNYGLSMAEAGRRVQLNVGRSAVLNHSNIS